MIRDIYLRIFFIPLLGIFIPMLSGIITYSNYTLVEIIGACAFFIFTSFAIWRGSNWVHTKLRPLFSRTTNPFVKIFSLCFVSDLYGGAIGGILVIVWLKMSREAFSWGNIAKFLALCSLAITLFTLIYEVLYLSKERELDSKIVDQLDRERSQAELAILRNELDPHFMFNSLNALSHLIINDPTTAHIFNSKLARVYRYFLLNKERELISLHEELEFIENYFYLLQIRHDNKLQLDADMTGVETGKIMILPCALQILIENAIKHNEFTDENPLNIKVSINETAIKVSNNIKPKPFGMNSTKIGLRNLSSRYRLVCNKDIAIETTTHEFIVKLPLIK